MDYLTLSIEELHTLIKEGKVTPQELARLAVEKARKLQPTLNGFETIIDDYKVASTNVDSMLFGIPYACKDNFSTKGIETTGSSNILNGYVPVYESTVTEKLAKAGATLIGKTVLDELALGGTGLNGHKGMVHNPRGLKDDRISGGSSAGSAVAVAAGIVPFAIGSDTGDSVRKPACLNGIVGFKPTWGRISRYGNYGFSSSLDHVGFFTRNVKDAAYVLEAIAGHDEKDFTSSNRPVPKYSSYLNADLNGKTIGVIKEINDSISNPNVKKLYEESLKKIEESGAKLVEFSMDENLLKAILPAYLVISCAEATSNDACFDGIKYGPRSEGATWSESMINTRTEGFSELVKRRFVIGSYALAAENQEKLFIRAQKVRRLIVNKVTDILNNCDCLLFPASGDIAPKKEDKEGERLSSNYLVGENHLAIGNFGGFPSLTLPFGFVNDMPVGLNITGRIFDEQTVLNVSTGIEKVLGYKDLVAKVGE